MFLKQILTACSTIVVCAACSNSPTHTTGSYRNQGYLLDTAGSNAVVKSLGYDECIRTSDWTPARANVDCDPDLVPKPIVKAPVAPPPPPKVEAAPPPKVVAPPPAKPVPQRFTLSTDTLFDFDKATLTAEGRKKLDELADTLRGPSYDSIAITGHTDRAGSVNYNQQLSERRAQAVKKYLEGKGLDVSKITAVGKGKSETKINPPACRAPGMTRAAVLACLQPDRRVEIEVNGTKDPGAPPAPRAAVPAAATAAKPTSKAAPAKAATRVQSKAKTAPKAAE